jgi:hypothetical protein
MQILIPRWCPFGLPSILLPVELGATLSIFMAADKLSFGHITAHPRQFVLPYHRRAPARNANSHTKRDARQLRKKFSHHFVILSEGKNLSGSF